MEQNACLDIAKSFGQDVDKVMQGEVVVTYHRIGQMQEARVLLCHAGDEEREKRGKTFFDGIAYRRQLSQGLHDRGEAFVFANAPELMEEGDEEPRKNHLPIHLQVVSALEKMELYQLSVF